MASRCTDGDYDSRSTCEAASTQNVWCTDSMPTAGPDDLENWLRCIDVSGVTDAVELVVVVGVTITTLLVGMALVRRIIQAARES